MTLSAGGQQLENVSVKLSSGGAGDPQVLAGTVDPSVGGGIVADEGSLFLRYVATAGELWSKTGSADTDWGQVSLGGSPSMDDTYNVGHTITVDAGSVIFDADSVDASYAVQITREPSGAAAANGMQITMGSNATGVGFYIDNNSSNVTAISIDHLGVSDPAILVDIQDAASGLKIVSAGGSLSNPLVDLSTSAGDNGGAIFIANAGDLDAIEINQTGGTRAVYITASGGTGDGVHVDMSGASGAPPALRLIGQGGSAKFTLADAANIATDAKNGNVFEVTLAGNRTLDNPTGLISGFTYLWIIKQSTGGHTLGYGTAFDFPGGTAPTLSVAAGAVDLLCGVYDGTNLLCSFTADFQ